MEQALLSLVFLISLFNSSGSNNPSVLESLMFFNFWMRSIRALSSPLVEVYFPSRILRSACSLSLLCSLCPKVDCLPGLLPAAFKAASLRKARECSTSFLVVTTFHSSCSRFWQLAFSCSFFPGVQPGGISSRVKQSDLGACST